MRQTILAALLLPALAACGGGGGTDASADDRSEPTTPEASASPETRTVVVALDSGWNNGWLYADMANAPDVMCGLEENIGVALKDQAGAIVGSQTLDPAAESWDMMHGRCTREVTFTEVAASDFYQAEVTGGGGEATATAEGQEYGTTRVEVVID